MIKLTSIIENPISGEWGCEDPDKIGLPILRTTNFTNEGNINYNNIITRIVKKNNIKEKFLQFGDILLEKSGGSEQQPVGRVVFFENENNKYLCNNFITILRLKNSDTYVNKFVFYSLFYNYIVGGTKKFQNKTTGLHNLQVTSFINTFQIKSYSIDKQQIIVKILDTINNLIKQNNDQLDKLNLLVKSRFVELFEEKFPFIKIGNVFKTTSGGTPNTSCPEYYTGGTIPWLTSGEVNQGIITSTKNYITEEGLNHSSAKWVPKNTIVIAMYGATAGQVGLLKIDSTTNQAICSVLPNPKFSPFYLYHAIAYKKEWMIQQCAGGAQPNISQGIIKKMEIISPPLPLQEEFASFVQQVDKSKFAVKQSLEKLEILKKSLMQEYFG